MPEKRCYEGDRGRRWRSIRSDRLCAVLRPHRRRSGGDAGQRTGDRRRRYTLELSLCDSCWWIDCGADGRQQCRIQTGTGNRPNGLVVSPTIFGSRRSARCVAFLSLR